MFCAGNLDNTCPANKSSASADGWYYTTVDATFSHWLKVNGCAAVTPSHYPTSFDGQYGLCHHFPRGFSCNFGELYDIVS